MQHDPLRPEKQLGRAQHERVIAAVQRVSQDHMDELIDEQRRQSNRPGTDQREIGGFQRRMPQQEVAESQNELPVLPRIGIVDRGKFVGNDRPTRVGEQFAVQSAFDCAGVFRRHQLGTCEIGLQKLIRNHQPAVRIAIKQMVAAGNPEILHGRRVSKLKSARSRPLSGSGSSSTSMNENALPWPLPFPQLQSAE